MAAGRFQRYNLGRLKCVKRTNSSCRLPGILCENYSPGCYWFALSRCLRLLSADTVVEEIIARINNQIVTRTEYLRSKEQLKQEAQQQDPANADKIVAEKDKDVLRDLIDQQLLLEKGKDLGITADTEVIKRLDEMRKEMKLESMEDLEKAASAQGISFEDFKQNLKNQIITQQVISKEVGSRMSISKEELQQFYDEHKSQMEQPEQIRLSELLVSTEKKDKDDPPADEAAAACGRASQSRRPAGADSQRSEPSTKSPRRIRTGPPPPRAAISDTSSAARWPRSSKTKRLP